MTEIHSQQISWWSVHTFIAQVLERVGAWPMVGTPAWCDLADDDSRKIAALFDAAQHWALRVETCQEARCQAASDIAEAADWSHIATTGHRRAQFYAAQPWLKRGAA